MTEKMPEELLRRVIPEENAGEYERTTYRFTSRGCQEDLRNKEFEVYTFMGDPDRSPSELLRDQPIMPELPSVDDVNLEVLLSRLTTPPEPPCATANHGSLLCAAPGESKPGAQWWTNWRHSAHAASEWLNHRLEYDPEVVCAVKAADSVNQKLDRIGEKIAIAKVKMASIAERFDRVIDKVRADGKRDGIETGVGIGFLVGIFATLVASAVGHLLL